MSAIRFGLVALVTVATVAIVSVGVALSGDTPDSVIVFTGLWGVLGAVIAALRPRNAVGWLFLAVGLVWTIGLTATAAVDHLGTGGMLTFVSWVSEWFWIAGFGLMSGSLYLIPTGRLPSRGWRPAFWLFEAAVVVLATVAALEDKLQASDTAPIVENPIGIDGLRDIEDIFGVGLGAIVLAGAVGAALSLVFRYRHGNAEERQQLKLVALAVPLAVASAVAAGASGGSPLRGVLWAVGLGAIPVAVTVAILRYRLFDVDRLIARTLVYGSLTVLLGAAYAALVLAGQAVFSSFAGGSNLAIAVSTLVVAALFLPLRTHVQRFVDRRFYRRRYDAQRTLERFGARLRDQVEIDGLRADLESVVGEAMHPAHVSLWLPGRSR